MRIDSQQVQANILRSVDPAFTRYDFFRVTDFERFRSFLLAALKRELTLPDTTTGFYSEHERFHRRRPSREKAARAKRSDQRGLLHMNIGFTLPGLERLGIAKETCKSFPEPFREGMAARATNLGDAGIAAPDNWQGYLGSREVDGILWWNWWNIPKEDRLPGKGYDGLAVRAQTTWEHIDAAAADYGITILHSETGVANYRRFALGEVDRVEHFGFRDGISQPWVDFTKPGTMGHPPPGGGTPRGDGRWDPLAPGEFVLGYPDEDGLVQPWPCNRELRSGGIYMVFRKLEQDVVGFRNFLHRISPDPQGSRQLAAQMFGRWPDGTPLVASPNGPNETNPGDPRRPVNDFRYETDDPRGIRCPIAAHIRRSNPRDTGGRNEARRHRLLRRGITYGGPMLPEDSRGDGNTRGVLFIALNARIDQQFELVQARWLNTGELVGQVGAGRDPINAANAGRHSDSFWSSSRPAPVTGLTRFVTMRGGDYFFVPGLPALKKLAEGAVFEAEPETQALRERSIGTFETPDPAALFERELPALPADGSEPFDPMVLPGFMEHPGATPRDYTIAFIARHQNVVRVLSDEDHFSVKPYRDAIARITGGENMIVGMSSQDPEAKKRIDIWKRAEGAYAGTPIEEIVEAAAYGIIGRCLPAGRLDVAQDLGRIVPLVLAASYYGVPGPDWLSPTAVAASFNKLTITDVPPSWLSTVAPIDPQDVPFASLQAWTRFAFAQVFANVVRASELTEVARGTTAELFCHLDGLIAKAHQLPSSKNTLLGCMVDQARGLPSTDFNAFNKRIRLTLAERIVGGTDTLNKALVNVINHLLDHPERMEDAKCAACRLHATQSSSGNQQELGAAQSQLDAVIRECLRFDPVAPVIFRVCEEDTVIGGKAIKRDTLVCLLTKGAMLDPSVFPNPTTFDPNARDANDYLIFGAGPHQCAGRATAEPVLRIMVKHLLLLKDLRRAAGPTGQIRNMLGLPLPDSLVVRFSTS